MNYLVFIKLKKLLAFIVVFFSTIMLFLFSRELRAGVLNGISLCLNSVIPSLFLFTILAFFVYESRLLNDVGTALQPLSRRIFRLNGQQTAVLLLSLISGYPIGAKLLNEMYKDKQIDIKTAKTMLSYCINAGPAFIVTAIGQAVLGSSTDGQRLLLAHVLSSIIMALVCSRALPVPQVSNPKENPPKVSTVEVFVSSVINAAKSMLNICAFVVVFSSACNLILNLNLPKDIAKSICNTLEVTVALQGQTRNQLPLIAFLLGFGGLSVIFQIMTQAKDIKPRFLSILASRILHGTTSAVLVYLFELIWPRTLETLSTGRPAICFSVTSNPAASVALVFLSITLIFFVGSTKQKTIVENS
jgi:hypothetical protein